MKHTKKLLTWILVVVLAAALLLVACVEKPQVQELTEFTLPTLADDQMAVIIKNGDNGYTNIVVTLGPTGTTAKTAEGILDYLAKNKLITVSMSGDSNSELGKSLDKLNDMVYDQQAHTYIASYTSVRGEGGGMDVAYTIQGTTLYYSNYGVSKMTVSAGTVLYFEGGSW